MQPPSDKNEIFKTVIAFVIPSLVGIGAHILSDAIYLPSLFNWIIFSVSVFLSLRIKLPILKYFFLFWNAWFVIGSISLVAQNNLSSGLNYNINPNLANTYFLLCVILAQIPALLWQGSILDRRLLENSRGVLVNNGFVSLFFVVFPMLYAFSIFLATGDVPLLSGRNVSSEMYNIDYGPIHSFGILVSCSIIALWLRYTTSLNKNRLQFIVVSFVIVTFCIFAAFDGRRVLALFALAGVLLQFFSKNRTLWKIATASAIAALVLAGYVLASTIRTGQDSQAAFEDSNIAISTVGVEYRDFIYAFNNLSIDEVRSAGYDWPRSTAAAAMPSVVLALFDINKTQEVSKDSARTLMYFWNVNLGIRIGLPGEIWLFAGWWGLPLFSIFGSIIFFVVKMLYRSRILAIQAILYTQLAVFLLAINGQSTVTFGLTLPLLYFSVFVLITHYAVGRRLSSNESF